jgi:hypothetical protein
MSPNRYGFVSSDERFAWQRSFYPPASRVAFADFYAIRVARLGNVVVVVEDAGITSDRPDAILTTALERALPTYPAPYRDGLCHWDPVGCLNHT